MTMLLLGTCAAGSSGLAPPGAYVCETKAESIGILKNFNQGTASFKAGAEHLCRWQQRVGTTWHVRLQISSRTT
jgi:hypothetical protein